MFTGLVADIGTVDRIAPMDKGIRLRILTRLADGSLGLGESIACDGCCLTVVAQDAGWFEVEISQESLDRTNLGGKQAGGKLNLERAMSMGDRLGGHWVQGHVDGVAKVAAIHAEGESYDFRIALPPDLLRYVVEKGSLTVSGVSLTVNTIAENTVGINLIRHTREHTTLGELSPGDAVNIEVDILAKYIETLIRPYATKAD